MDSWRRDSDFMEQATGLFGFVAGDNFEGWESYWNDQRSFEVRLLELLDEWWEFVEQKMESVE